MNLLPGTRLRRRHGRTAASLFSRAHPHSRRGRDQRSALRPELHSAGGPKTPTARVRSCSTYGHGSLLQARAAYDLACDARGDPSTPWKVPCSLPAPRSVVRTALGYRLGRGPGLFYFRQRRRVPGALSWWALPAGTACPRRLVGHAGRAGLLARGLEAIAYQSGTWPMWRGFGRILPGCACGGADQRLLCSSGRSAQDPGAAALGRNHFARRGRAGGRSASVGGRKRGAALSGRRRPALPAHARPSARRSDGWASVRRRGEPKVNSEGGNTCCGFSTIALSHLAIPLFVLVQPG